MSAIRLDGVSKRFGSMVAVEPLSLQIDEGEMVALLGPSGSGKSTILSMIAGLSRPTSGRLSIAERDVTDVPPASRNIGLVLQSYALFPNQTVYGNVAFPLQVRGVKASEIERRVKGALEQVRLTGFELRRPSQLSGGQQQRVALARAIVFRPEILLLDEPMAALDRKLREDVQLEIKQLQREIGITTIIVTHDQEEALSLAERVVVMDKGRVQQVGTPSNVYHKPCNRFVARFVGTANLFEGQAAPSDGGFRTKSGVLLPCSPELLKGPVTALLVRPESVRFATRGDMTLPGVVAEVVYVGHHVKLHVRLRTGEELIAHVTSGQQIPSIGDSVGMTWNGQDAWLLND